MCGQMIPYPRLLGLECRALIESTYQGYALEFDGIRSALLGYSGRAKGKVGV